MNESARSSNTAVTRLLFQTGFADFVHGALSTGDKNNGLSLLDARLKGESPRRARSVSKMMSFNLAGRKTEDEDSESTQAGRVAPFPIHASDLSHLCRPQEWPNRSDNLLRQCLEFRQADQR